MLYYIMFFFSRCNTRGHNKFESDITKSEIQVNCAVDNSFEQIEWPNCVSSKSILI